jgi:hypothetical protein
VGEFIRKFRQRRDDRRLSRELEQRFREQLDARAIAADQLSDELRPT